MKLIFFSVSLLFASILQSCTPYGPAGYMGGYTDRILGGGYYTVNFAGNGYTSPQRVADLALLRACELALRDGYAKFVTIGARNNTVTDYAQTPGMATTTGSYSYGTYVGTTVYTPPTSIPISKPDTNVSIQGLPTTAKNGSSLVNTIATIKQKYNMK